MLLRRWVDWPKCAQPRNMLLLPPLLLTHFSQEIHVYMPHAGTSSQHGLLMHACGAPSEEQLGNAPMAC